MTKLHEAKNKIDALVSRFDALRHNLAHASAKARQNKSKSGSFHSILAQGETAARKGKTLEDNPFPKNTEDYDTWKEGFEDYKMNGG